MSLPSGGSGGPAPRKPGAQARPGAQPRSAPGRPLGPLAPDAPDPSRSWACGQTLRLPRASHQVSFDRGGRRLSLQGSERRQPGRRRVPAYLHWRLPAARRRCRAPRRTCSPASDLEATASVNTHTHTLVHGNSVVKGGPSPADQYHPPRTHTQHLGRRITQSRSVSMEQPFRICKSKSEIKPPPISSSSSLPSSSSSSQPQRTQ